MKINVDVYPNNSLRDGSATVVACSNGDTVSRKIKIGLFSTHITERQIHDATWALVQELREFARIRRKFVLEV